MFMLCLNKYIRRALSLTHFGVYFGGILFVWGKKKLTNFVVDNMKKII